MGNGASAGLAAATAAATPEDLKAAMASLDPASKAKLAAALNGADAASATQSAFVFVKPHANTSAVQDMVKEKFAAVGIKILSEGEVPCGTLHTQRTPISVSNVHVARIPCARARWPLRRADRRPNDRLQQVH